MKRPSSLRRRDLLRIGAIGAAGAATAALAGCGETQVVTQEVVKVVTQQVPVEKVVTQVVEKERVVEVEKPVEVEVERVVTQIVEKEKVVEKEKIVEKIVTVEVAPKLRSVTLTGWTFAHLPRWHKANGDLFAAQTNVKTEWVGVSEIWDKLSVALQTGVGAPDMVDIEQGPMGRYLKGDIQLVDLKPMLTREGFWDKLVTSRQALYTWEGKTYGVEYALTPVVMYYNLSLFEKYGIDPEAGMATWDDFVESGQRMKSASGGETLITGTGTGALPMPMEPMFRQRNRDYFTADGEVGLDDPVLIETMQWMEDLRAEGGIADRAEPWSPGMWGAFKEEHHATTVGADWIADFLRDNVGAEGEGKWRAQPLPLWADDPTKTDTSCWGGTGIMITTHTQFVEEAWEYIKFGMLTIDGSVRRYKDISQFPAFLPAMESSEISFADPYYGGQDLTEVFKFVARRVPAQHQHPFRPELRDVWESKILPDVLDGNVGVEEGLTQAAAEVRDIIAKGG